MEYKKKKKEREEAAESGFKKKLLVDVRDQYSFFFIIFGFWRGCWISVGLKFSKSTPREILYGYVFVCVCVCLSLCVTVCLCICVCPSKLDY